MGAVGVWVEGEGKSVQLHLLFTILLFSRRAEKVAEGVGLVLFFPFSLTILFRLLAGYLGSWPVFRESWELKYWESGKLVHFSVVSTSALKYFLIDWP